HGPLLASPPAPAVVAAGSVPPRRPVPGHPGRARRGRHRVDAGAARQVVGGVASLRLPAGGEKRQPSRRAGAAVPARRRRDPQGRPVNRSAANAGVLQTAVAPEYRLVVEGRVRRPLSFTAEELSALPSHEATLPISCVEGWSYSARWRGVRVRDLLVMAGARP